MDLSKKTFFKLIGFYCLSMFLMSFIIQSIQKESNENLEEILSVNTRSAVVELKEEKVEEIVLTEDDLTGFKRILLRKRKRIARKKARAERAVAQNDDPHYHHPSQGSGFVAASKSIKAKSVNYSAQFDSLSKEGTLRSHLLDEAQKYMGTRYVWGGTTPRGFDCSGFTSYVLKKFGVEVSRSSRHQARQGGKVELKNVKKGDLVFFSKYGKGGRVTHVAMVADNRADGVYVIHATRRGVVIDNLTKSKYWRPKTLYAKNVIDEKVKQEG